MIESPRARPASSGGWDRARRAYLALLGPDDPAAAVVGAGALDLRLGYDPDDADPLRRLVVSGPDDLMELREIVERAVGPGAWPSPPLVAGDPVGTRLGPGRGPAMLGLLMAMDGLVERRSPWGGWRTVVDSVASRVAALDGLTVDLRVIEPGR